MQAVLWLLNTNSVLFSAGGILINFIRQNTFSAKASLFIRLSKNPLNISLNCFFIIIHIHAHTNYQQLYSSIVLSFLSWRTSSFVIIQLQFSTVFSIPILFSTSAWVTFMCFIRQNTFQQRLFCSFRFSAKSTEYVSKPFSLAVSHIPALFSF